MVTRSIVAKSPVTVPNSALTGKSSCVLHLQIRRHLHLHCLLHRFGHLDLLRLHRGRRRVHRRRRNATTVGSSHPFESSKAYMNSLSPEGLGMLLGAIVCVVALTTMLGVCLWSRFRDAGTQRGSSRRRRRKDANVSIDEFDDIEGHQRGSRTSSAKSNESGTRKSHSGSKSRGKAAPCHT